VGHFVSSPHFLEAGAMEHWRRAGSLDRRKVEHPLSGQLAGHPRLPPLQPRGIWEPCTVSERAAYDSAPSLAPALPCWGTEKAPQFCLVA
jgi:hypothetical protein